VTDGRVPGDVLTFSQPWIFFIEGAITIVVAGVAFFFLPNTPGTARFLTEDERVVAAVGRLGTNSDVMDISADRPSSLLTASPTR
jgi:hypothetical protein